MAASSAARASAGDVPLRVFEGRTGVAIWHIGYGEVPPGYMRSGVAIWHSVGVDGGAMPGRNYACLAREPRIFTTTRSCSMASEMRALT